jgi:hypothetical protein
MIKDHGMNRFILEELKNQYEHPWFKMRAKVMAEDLLSKSLHVPLTDKLEVIDK